MVICATWSLIQVITRALPLVADRGLFKRIKPLAGVIICTAGVFAPGLYPDMQAAEKVLLGVVLGQITGHAHKIMKHTILGETGETKKSDVDVDPEDLALWKSALRKASKATKKAIT